MNLAETRTLVRTMLGLPDTGTKGRTRLDEMINNALRYVTPQLPEPLLRRQYRMRLESAWTVGTLSGVASDLYVLEIIDITSGYVFPPATEIRARTLEVSLGGERYFTTQIRDFFFKVELGGPSRYFFVLDTPFYDASLTGLTYRVYTDAYPIPLTAIDIQTVQLSVTSQLLPLAFAESHSGLLALRRTRGWRASGRVQAYSDGDAQALPAPRQAPVASVLQEPTDAEKWGYDTIGTEHGSAYAGHQYGPAGTFEYCYCLGWGRRPTPQDAHGGSYLSTPAATFPGEIRFGKPFLLSGRSNGTGPISTTWGGSAIKLSSPNMHYVWGYNARSSAFSRNHSGLEKWWFRRRITTATSPAGGSPFDAIESDGVWYLWRITDAGETETWDRGDSDPPDREFELPRNYGHRFIRFDITQPTPPEDVLLEYTERPTLLQADEDVVPIPDEHMEIIVVGVKAQLANRDGDKQGVALARAEQEALVRSLRDRYGRDSFVAVEFGRVTMGGGTGLWPWPTPPVAGL